MPHNVLLVHTSPDLRSRAARALPAVNARLDVVDDGTAGRMLLAGDRYSVVVIEHGVAGELLDSLVAMPSPKPIVVVTAAARDAQMLDPETVSLLVPEPYDPAMVVGVILACLAEERNASSVIPLPGIERGEGPEVC